LIQKSSQTTLTPRWNSLELPGGSDFKWKREQSALYMQAQDSQQAIDKEVYGGGGYRIVSANR
jgi:hypothetical protein